MQASAPGPAVLARIEGFVMALRANGFIIGLREAADALTLAATVGLAEKQPLRWGWRSLLCTRPADWTRFDGLFDSYWLPPNARALVETRVGGAGLVAFADEPGSQAGRAGPVLQREDAEEDAGLPGDDTAKDGASAAAALADADFRSLTDRLQTYAIEDAIRAFARRLKRLRTRREQSRPQGTRIDLRRTLRASIATGGSPQKLRFRAARRVRPRFVLLLDVSRSMSLTSFFYLRVARALSLELGDVHVFLYHTHLTPVSEALRDPDPWRAQERLQLLSAGWAGGTRIGECLALARRARRIIWFNPAKADPRYQPLARGMREALPFIDKLTAVNSLTALEEAFASVLETL
jgi:uncharacterized protein with von Willebrand factor type A (vWA) domain